MNLRGILLCAIMTALAAVSALAESSRGALPFVVHDVQVDISGLDQVRAGLDKTRAQIGADIEAALRQSLAPSPRGDVDVAVRVSRIKMLTRVESAIPMERSRITAQVAAVRVEDGQAAIAPFEISAGASGFRLPGLIGMVAAPTKQKDYMLTITGFAAKVRERLTADQG